MRPGCENLVPAPVCCQGWGSGDKDGDGGGRRYIGLTSVLEGFVILRQNPDYVDDHLG